MPTMTTTWRDLTDELTPTQIAELTKWELFEHGDKPGGLLCVARGMAAHNLAAAVLSDLPLPAGAVAVNDWEHMRDNTWARHFWGTTRRAGPASVVIHGEQSADGSCERWLHVRDDDDSELTPAQARELASALSRAADEVDQA
jgi:hypothetical protein